MLELQKSLEFLTDVKEFPLTEGACFLFDGKQNIVDVAKSESIPPYNVLRATNGVVTATQVVGRNNNGIEFLSGTPEERIKQLINHADDEGYFTIYCKELRYAGNRKYGVFAYLAGKHSAADFATL